VGIGADGTLGGEEAGAFGLVLEAGHAAAGLVTIVGGPCV